MAEHEATDPPVDQFGQRMNTPARTPACELDLEHGGECIGRCSCTCHQPTEDEKRRYEREYAGIKSTDSQEGS